MNYQTRLRIVLSLLIGAVPLSFASGPIVTSDGPGESNSSPRSNVVVSEGPSGGRSNGIVTTDGPAKLPYHYPLPIIISNGPSQLPYAYNRTGAVEISEGPDEKTASQSNQSKKSIEVSDGPGQARTVPDPETSTLAPVSVFEGAARPVATAVKSSASPHFFGTIGTHAVSSKEPFYVYSDRQNSGNHFVASGWMGDYRDIRLNESSRVHPHSGNTCIKITYSAKGTQGNGWAGIYWQTPANNWGDKPGGYDLSSKRRLTFWARGEKGGEVITEFKMGGIQGENSDSTSAGTGSIVLKKEWQKYTIGLADLDLTHVIGGFCWSTSRDANPDGVTFYLDDIRYE